eukprot:COSAG02_NODE_4940_length_4809_cov_26.880042_8_plen_173_part_00
MYFGKTPGGYFGKSPGVYFGKSPGVYFGKIEKKCPSILAGIGGAKMERTVFFPSDGSAVEMEMGHEVYDGSDSGEFWNVLDLLLVVPCLGVASSLYLWRRADRAAPAAPDLITQMRQKKRCIEMGTYSACSLLVAELLHRSHQSRRSAPDCNLDSQMVHTQSAIAVGSVELP